MANTYDLTTSGGIGYSLLNEGSGMETYDFSPDNIVGAAQLVAICDWNNRGSLISATLYKPHPVITWAYAVSFAVEPWGNPIGGAVANPVWNQAKITCNFKNLPYSLLDFKEVVVESDSSLVSLGKEVGQFPDGADVSSMTPTDDVKVYLPLSKIKITFHNQGSFNENAAQSLINNVNNASWKPDTYNPAGASFPIGQALFTGYDYSKKYGPNGNLVYDYTYNFLGSPIDHRKEFSIHTGDYEKFIFKQSGNYKYTLGSFSTLGV